MHDNENAKKIILKTSLKGYFFEGLVELNKKSLCPLPESVIFYSSDVLDKFLLSQDFFEVSDGRVREKILGIKLLEATQLNKEDQKRVFREVGDMSLMICGYFAESINKKIVDLHYYAKLGKMAYAQLNQISPSFLDIPSFYGIVATSFEPMTSLISMLASGSRNHGNKSLFDRVMRGEDVSDLEMLTAGIIPVSTKRVS
jgi:hypothetical protein